MNRWIPKKGETVTLAGGGDVPRWHGVVEKVSKLGCQPNTVRVAIRDKGWTTATRAEITIHDEIGMVKL